MTWHVFVNVSSRSLHYSQKNSSVATQV